MDILQSINSIEFLLNNRWESLLSGTGITILINVITILLGLLIGAGLFLWRYAETKPGKVITDGISIFFTYVPPANWLLLVFYIIFRGKLNLNFTAAIATLSVLFGFDVFSTANSALDQVSDGEKEAAISMGYSRHMALKKIYIPRAMPFFLEGLKPCLRALIQNSAFVELINVADIQFVSDKLAAENANAVAPLLLSTAIYIILEIVCHKIIDRLLEKYKHEKPAARIKENINKGKF